MSNSHKKGGKKGQTEQHKHWPAPPKQDPLSDPEPNPKPKPHDPTPDSGPNPPIPPPPPPPPPNLEDDADNG
jgi:hypothetical protein